MSNRLALLQAWLSTVLPKGEYTLAPASADASFRRYFRVQFRDRSLIVMDAPPQQENSEKFIKIAHLMANFGLNVPIIYEINLEQGFLLLSDLGERLYLSELKDGMVNRLYGDALSALVVLQSQVTTVDLPSYDAALLMREQEIFREWYLLRHLQLKLDDNLNQAITECFEFLAQNALSQPRVIVHRDFHSRNLLITEQHSPGILDFQDAVIGPATYDVVSLLRDCYIRWPRQQVIEWVAGYHDLCLQSGILRDVSLDQYTRWFDLMGAQRHLKAAGIFARLNYRDQKPGYLKDIPRTLNYVVEVCAAYKEMRPIVDLIRDVDSSAKTVIN